MLNEYGVSYRDRVFSPVTTIWGFLSQVLSEDHSCRDTVSRIIAHRTAHGMAMCSPNTASYCTARSRISTGVLSTLAKRTAEELHASVDDRWKWNGRSVFILDGCWRRPDIGPFRRPDDRLAGSGRWRPDVLSIRQSRKIFCRFLDRIAELDMIVRVAPRLHAGEQLRLPAGNWNDVWRPAQHPRLGLEQRGSFAVLRIVINNYPILFSVANR